MAFSEDRPIIVNGGHQMVTVKLPPATKPSGGSHTLNALPAAGPFKTIVFTNVDTNEVFKMPATGNWTIKIE